jgi:hypothetical protein
MSAALFPEPVEPPGSGLPRGGWGEDEGAAQGLYVTLPAEELTWKGSPRTARPILWRRARCWPWCWAR